MVCNSHVVGGNAASFVVQLACNLEVTQLALCGHGVVLPLLMTCEEEEGETCFYHVKYMCIVQERAWTIFTLLVIADLRSV